MRVVKLLVMRSGAGRQGGKAEGKREKKCLVESSERPQKRSAVSPRQSTKGKTGKIKVKVERDWGKPTQ